MRTSLGGLVTQHFEPQGSFEWLKLRQKHIGASEVACLFGSNPWADYEDMFIKKQVEPQPEKKTSSQARGNKLERVARSQYELFFGVDITGTDGVFSCESPRLIASLDGYDAVNDCVVEIKAPSADTIDHARRGLVPVYYWLQMQAQMFMVDSKRARFICHDGHYIVAAVDVSACLETQKEILKRAALWWASLPGPWSRNEHQLFSSRPTGMEDFVRGDLVL